MQLTRKKAKIVEKAIDAWKDDGVIDIDKAEELHSSINKIWIDWKRLARISIRISIVCIVISIFSLFANEAILELLENLLDISAVGGGVILTLVAAGFFTWGARRKVKKPEKIYSTEVIFLFGVFAVAGAISCLAASLELGESSFPSLILLATVVYGILGFFLSSVLVWFLALCCLGGWLGAVTGYVSGWGAYYFGMNYPLRFAVFGVGLTALGYGLMNTERFQVIERTTRVMGLIYLFMALWIMSIFGNYGDMDVWYDVPKYMLLHWVIIFGAVALAAIYIGLRRDDGLIRGFGITFLFINLYTRFCEYFWSPLPKALFFGLLAVSFWFIGVRAEKIWNMGGRVSKSTTASRMRDKLLTSQKRQ